MNRVLASCSDHNGLNDQEARLCKDNLQFIWFGRFYKKITRINYYWKHAQTHEHKHTSMYIQPKISYEKQGTANKS